MQNSKDLPNAQDNFLKRNMLENCDYTNLG